LVRHMRGLSSGTNHFGTQHSGPRTRERIDISEIKIWRHGCVAKKTISIKSQVLRGGVAAILPNSAYSPIEVSSRYIGLIQGLYSAREDERSLVCNERLSSQLCLLASSNPQNASEGRDNNSGNRGDRSLAFIQKVSRASNVIKDHGAASGILFLVGISLFGGMVLAYALLECWRKKALY